MTVPAKMNFFFTQYRLMKPKVIWALFVIVLVSCKEKPIGTSQDKVKEIPRKFLPFQKVNLDDLSGFPKNR